MSRETKQPQQGESITLMSPQGGCIETEVVAIKSGKLWFKDIGNKAKQMCVTIVSWRIHWNLKSQTWVASIAGDETWKNVQDSRVGLSKGAL